MFRLHEWWLGCTSIALTNLYPKGNPSHRTLRSIPLELFYKRDYVVVNRVHLPQTESLDMVRLHKWFGKVKGTKPLLRSVLGADKVSIIITF